MPWPHRILHRLLPPTCLECGQAGDLGPLDACSYCLAELPWLALPDSRLPQAAFAYAPPVDHWLRAVKFRGDLRGAAVLGALLAGLLAATRRDPWPQAIVPVPLHRSRCRERGFDQAQVLAQQLARWLALPVAARLLQRTRATRAQTALGAAARRHNLDGAFALRRGAAMPWHVALLDDVITTGATTRAAADALRAAGVQRIEVWAIARARPSAGLTVARSSQPGPVSAELTVIADAAPAVVPGARDGRHALLRSG